MSLPDPAWKVFPSLISNRRKGVLVPLGARLYYLLGFSSKGAGGAKNCETDVLMIDLTAANPGWKAIGQMAIPAREYVSQR